MWHIFQEPCYNVYEHWMAVFWVLRLTLLPLWCLISSSISCLNWARFRTLWNLDAVTITYQDRLPALWERVLTALSSALAASNSPSAPTNSLLPYEIAVAPSTASSLYLSLTSWFTSLFIFPLIFHWGLFTILNQPWGNTCLLGAEYSGMAGLRQACTPLAKYVSGHVTFHLSAALK